jgi:hypothetical protein
MGDIIRGLGTSGPRFCLVYRAKLLFSLEYRSIVFLLLLGVSPFLTLRLSTFSLFMYYSLHSSCLVRKYPFSAAVDNIAPNWHQRIH